MFGLNKVTGRGRQTVDALKMYNDGTVSTKYNNFNFNYNGDSQETLSHYIYLGSKVKKMCYISMIGQTLIDGISVNYLINLGENRKYKGIFIPSVGTYTILFLIEWTNGIVKVWRNEQNSQSGTTATTLVDVYSTGMNCINESLYIKYTSSRSTELTGTANLQTTINYN